MIDNINMLETGDVYLFTKANGLPDYISLISSKDTTHVTIEDYNFNGFKFTKPNRRVTLEAGRFPRGETRFRIHERSRIEYLGNIYD